MRTLRKLLIGPVSLGVSLGVGLGTVSAPRSARADEIDTLGQRIVELEAQVRELDIQLKPQGQTAEAVARRLIDGEVLYELKNYEAAATIFLDITEKYPTSPEYPEALYFLADSLYLKRDFLSARRYFEKTVETGARAKHYQQALQRLIELSLYTGDYAPVDSYLQQLGNAGASDPNSSVPYVKGKYFFFRQRYDDAIATLSAIPRASTYWFQAQYFVGASKVASQRPGEAVQVFDALSKAEAKSDSQKRVVELAHLALGRVYYDQGQLSAATNEYSKIAQTSDAFADSLFEGAWVAVKDKLYAKAFRALDLLLTVQPTGPQAPEVKLLIGNLHIRQGEWEKATDSFTATRNEYEKVKADMDEALKKQGDSEAFFRDLIKRNLAKFDITVYLPPSAAKWAEKDPDIERLGHVTGDIAELKKSLAESEDILARVEKAMDTPARVNIFPELAHARTTAMQTHNQLIELENLLIQKERQLTAGVMGSDRAELDRTSAERQRMEKQIAELPKGPDSYDERMKRAREALDGLDKQAVELNVAIASYTAERVAIEIYFKASNQQGSAEVMATFEKQLADVKAAEEELVHTQSQLRTDIAEASQAVGVDDAQMQAEAGLKRQYADAMAHEHELLARARDRLSQGERGKVDQIEEILARARNAEGSIASFNSRIDGLIDTRLQEFRGTVAEEKVNLAKYEGTLGGYGGEAVDVGGGVTAQSFKNIADRFYQIVVRADVGIIDVAWALKQTKTDENSRLVREKKRELKLLDDEFKEVLKE